MIDCDNWMETKDWRKVVYRKKSVKWENARRKEKQGGWKHSHSLRPSSSPHVYRGGLSVRAHPAPSGAIKLTFPAVDERKSEWFSVTFLKQNSNQWTWYITSPYPLPSLQICGGYQYEPVGPIRHTLCTVQNITFSHLSKLRRTRIHLVPSPPPPPPPPPPQQTKLLTQGAERKPRVKNEWKLSGHA